MKTKPLIVGLITVVSTSSAIAQEILVPDAPQWIGWALAVVALISTFILVFLINERLRVFVLDWINLICKIRPQWPLYRKDKPYTRQSLELLTHLSQVSVEIKDFSSDRCLKFFLRGYNATPFPLEFRLRGGNIVYCKPGSDPEELPTPALEVPWKYDDSAICPPYKQFGLHLVQTFPDNTAKEISDVLAGKGHVDFSFGKLEVYADVLCGKRVEILLDFTLSDWTTIRLSLKTAQLHVGRVISAHAHAIVTAKPEIGVGK